MPVLIGIAGGSASGKSTLAHGLVHLLGQDRVLWLLQDSYYRELHGQTLLSQSYTSGAALTPFSAKFNQSVVL